MKNPITTCSVLLMLLFSISSFANNTNPPVFKIETVNFQMAMSLFDTHVSEISYNKSNGNLNFVTLEEVQFLQVLNEDNELQYQLPVNSNNITIDLNQLDKGNYLINIMIDDNTVIPGKFSNK